MRKGSNKQTPSFVLANGTNNQAPEGTASVAGGVGTISIRDEQGVYGNYNKVSDEDTYQVGNGTEDDRSNAIEIKSTGQIRFQGGQVWMYDAATDTRLPVVAQVKGFRENVYVGNG